MRGRDVYEWFDPFRARDEAASVDRYIADLRGECAYVKEQALQKAAYYKGRSEAYEATVTAIALAQPIRVRPFPLDRPLSPTEAILRRDEEPWKC